MDIRARYGVIWVVVLIMGLSILYGCSSNPMIDENSSSLENGSSDHIQNDSVENDNMVKYTEVPLLDNEDFSYSNPADINNIGDPFILEARGKYYCFPTSAPNGFKVWSSEDLIEWEDEGLAYKRTGSSWSGDSYWAPEVVEYENKFYMFYTARTLNNPTLRIGLAISDNPEGPYIDYEDKPFYDPGYAVIDASVFIDDDGRKYMYYSIDCSENIIDGVHESHIAVIELADDLMSTVGEPVVISKPDQPWEQISGPEWLWNEGPIILKRNDKYYMFYSANGFADKAYSVGYSVSDNPMGPFEKHHQPLLWHTEPDKETGIPAISGPGHNSLALSPDKKEIFIVYHTHTKPDRPSGDRQVAMDRIGFREDGTLYANGPTLAPQPLPSGTRSYSLIKPDRIKSSDKNENILFDGEAGMSQDLEETWHVDDNGWVEMEWDKPQNISTIALYPGKDMADIGQVFDIIIDDQYIISQVELRPDDSTPGYCALLNFEPIEASRLKIIFHEDKEVSLSEIMLLSKDG